MVTAISAPLYRRIVWTLRACARRDRGLDIDARRLSKDGLKAWSLFAGRLHEGDLVQLLVENNAALNPLALRPLTEPVSAEDGSALLTEALEAQPSLLTASSATFLEAAAVNFGRPPLGAERRGAFEAIRSQEQRILEFPSTAGRVSAMVASPGAPLETYVGYVVADDDDAFLVGLTMLEFDRNVPPTLLHVDDLRAGRFVGIGTFSRAATLGGEDEIIALLPPGILQRKPVIL